jgi:hypothetical protein
MAVWKAGPRWTFELLRAGGARARAAGHGGDSAVARFKGTGLPRAWSCMYGDGLRGV